MPSLDPRSPTSTKSPAARTLTLVPAPNDDTASEPVLTRWQRFTRSPFWTVLRRLALIVLVVGTAAYLLRCGVPTVSTEELHNGVPVTVDSPMSITDVRVFAFLAVAALLAVPDLSELDIAGLVSVKRKVQELREETTELKDEARALQATLQQVQTQALSNRNNLSVTNTFPGAQEATASALDPTSSEEGSLPEVVEDGAMRQLAFEAAFNGLPNLLRALPDSSQVVGCTFDSQGKLTPTHSTGAEYVTDLGDLADLVEWGGVSLKGGYLGEYQVLTAPAEIADNGVTGALVVIFPANSWSATVQTIMTTVDDMMTSTVIAATAYGLYLADLLGETPRPNPLGQASTQEAQ